MSRTSVRQALTALRVRGVVEVRHGDGIYLLHHADDLLGTLAEGLIESHAHLPAVNEAREALCSANSGDQAQLRLGKTKHGL